MNNSDTHFKFVSALIIAAVTVVYATTAKLSFLFTIPPGNISPVFPAAGVALAAAMLLGRKALLESGWGPLSRTPSRLWTDPSQRPIQD